MAEVLAALSTIAAAGEILSPAVKYVGQLYKAPQYVIYLKEQIQSFDCVIHALEIQQRSARSTVLANAVSDARSTIDEASGFLAAKCKDGYLTGSISRFTCARNRKYFIRLCQRLESSRKQVNEALTTESYFLQRRIEIVISDDANNTMATSFQADQIDDEAMPHSKPSLVYGPASQRKSTSVTAQQQPSSSFELLASWRPELYTDAESTPTLFGYFIQEVHKSEFMRICECALFYLSAPRRWARITASITTMRQSKYWDFTVADLRVKPRAFYSLPLSLNTSMRRYLATRSQILQDSHLTILLDKESTKEEPPESQPLEMRLIKPPSSLSLQQQLSILAEDLAHSGLSWYSEAQLDMRPLRKDKKPDKCFLTWLESRWVLAYRFGSENFDMNSHLYAIEVLHSLRGLEGVATLAGVFSENGRRDTVNGFLSELPAMGRLAHALLECEGFSSEDTMERKLGWCRDLVQGMANIHQKKLVVGSMQGTDCGIGIDGRDRAVYYNRFMKTVERDACRPGIVPPEFRNSMPSRDSIQATYRTDLYDLGFLLWRIVEDRLVGRLCAIWSCDTPTDTICGKQHPDPIQLPVINQNVPAYIRKVISICRSEDPSKRLPAWQLLQLFPCRVETNITMTKTLEMRPLTRLEDCYELFGCHTNCDWCGKIVQLRYFHCSTCEDGDYDLCLPCFNNGAHCRDDEHWLRESLEGLKEDRLWSAVPETGQRQVFTI